MSFSQRLNRWIEGSQREVFELNKSITLRLMKGVLKDTPVLEGRLRSNWFPTKGAPSNETSEQIVDLNVKIAEIDNFIKSTIKPDEDFDVYLTNNLPYAYRIEYQEYSKIKAPRGMVRINLFNVAEKLR
jgi:hypothetical protein